MIYNRSEFVLSRACIITILGSLVCASSIAFAQDGDPIVIGEHEKLKFFELESFRASLEAYWRYRNDESTDSNGVSTTDTETFFRETLLLEGEAYLGDPNLVKLNLNLSIRLSQEEIDSESQGRSDRTAEIFNEYDVSAVILQRSSSPLTVYSRRSQVLLDRQFADSLDSNTTEHGARLTLRSELMPSEIQYFHREQDQTGRFSGVDSQITQDTFSWQGRIKPFNGHRMWWDYTFSSVEESGQLIVPNSFDRHDAFFNHTYDFGPDSRNSIRSSLRIYKETGKFPIERIRLNETLLLEHSADFETKYIYLFDEQKRRTTDQTLNRGVASFRHDLFESLTTTGEIGASQLQISDGNFESTQYFANLAFQYRKTVPLGVLDATADINYNTTDDSERGASIFITDESHTFGVSGLIILNRRNIIPGSIVITNTAGIIIYIEGSDYTLLPLGESIEIRRVLGGNIIAGQTVLITYEIGPEPESTTDTAGIGMTIRYTFDEGPLKGVSPYLRYRDQSQDRVSPSMILLPVTDFQDLVFGVDYNLGHFTFTGEHQIHDSTISPFSRTRFEGRYFNRINNRNSVSMNAYFQELTRDDEDLQTTITNITARWNSQASNRLRSSVIGIYRREEDNTGTSSDAYEVAVDLTWRHRQTTVYCTIRNSIINSNTRDSTLQTFVFGARREF
jgi:hypothetical protein